MAAATRTTSSQFFVAGGTLRRDASSYVARRADDLLARGLSEGDFCYVLTSRQMGKSSLMVRTAARLREEGASVVVLDLTAIGQNLTSEQWYYGLLERAGAQLDLEDEVEAFWDRHGEVGPLRRWMSALEEVVLTSRPGRVVVFVDEIDAVRSLPFSTDEFFAGIRELYNRRTEAPDLERLTFCLLGVASPSDLIRDTRTTPFNIGRRIELADFTLAEAAPLAAGLDADPERGRGLLERVMYWTGGHPYLTQRLCQEVVSTGDAVDTACERLFLGARARERDDNLLFVRERLLRSEVDLTSLLELYAKVRAGRRVDDDETNPLVTVLALSGIARVEAGRLRVRNRIYHEVFDRAWIADSIPEGERRRQRAAFRRGLFGATGVALVVLAVIAGLAVAAVRQRNEAQRQRLLYRKLLYASQMNLAQQAWDAANVPRVVDILASLEPREGESDLRDFEWHYLRRLANQARVVVPVSAGVAYATVSADSQYFATANGDGTISVVRAADGELMAHFHAHQDSTRVVQFAPRDMLLASGGPDGTAALWDARTGRLVHAFTGLGDGVRSLAFSPDGRTLATGGYDKVVRFWDVETGRETGRIEGFGDTVGGVAFSPDGSLIATATYDSKLKVFDAASHRVLAERAYEPATQIWSIAFSPDGRTIATGAWDSMARLYDTRLQELAVLAGHTDLVTTVAFTPDGRSLVTASYDMTVRYWDVASHAPAGVLKGHTHFVFGLAISPDGRWLATGGKDQTARVWDAAPPRDWTEVGRARDSVWAAAFSPDGRLLATGDGGRPPEPDRGQIKLWDVATGGEVAALDGHEQAVRAVAFSPDGATLASASSDGAVRLWDVAARRERAAIRDLPGGSMGAVYSPDGARLAVVAGAQLSLWDAASLERLAAAEVPGESDFWGVAFSPDGTRIATAGSDGHVRLWDAASLAELADREDHTDAVFAVAFSPDGALLASAANDGVVILRDPATLEQVGALKGHRGWVWGLSFSPDGRRIATGSLDSTVKLWDTETRQEVSSYRGHEKLVTRTVFSPDGALLASVGNDHAVHLRRAR